MCRWTRFLLAATLLLSIAAPTLGQTDAVSIQLKLGPGESLFYAEKGSIAVTYDSGTGSRTSEGGYESREAIRVLEIGALGSMVIEYAVENYRFTEGGKTVERLMPAVTFRVEPDGKIVERSLGLDERVDFPFPLPGRPVRIGETWSRQTVYSSGEIKVTVTGTYTLAALGAGPDGRTARVRFVAQGNASSGQTILGLIPAQTRSTVSISGEYEWLLEKGRNGRYTHNMAFTSNTQVTLPGLSGLVRVSAKGAIRGEPVAPESLTVTAASPDLTVHPGRAIGPNLLSATVDEISRQLGTSEFRDFGLGFSSYSRRWPGGMVAYVSSDDNNTVLGLETDDTRYQTARGIKVGSSQGAVLLAYGPSPQRVEMSIPGRGAMSVLVYNSQGIAFAVTSELQERQTATRIPIGLVNWLTVFPPGAAARIFPLPGVR